MDDFSQMQSAAELMREGLSEFESGLSTHRLLAEGESPKNVALSWFKQEMNILPTETTHREKRFFGLSIFHFVVMTILILFSASMVAMYFFKMRRASLLLERLTSPGRPGEGGGATPLRTSTPSPLVDGNSRGEGGSQAQERRSVATIENDLPLSLERWTGKLKLAAVFQETPAVKTFRFVDPTGGSIPFNYLPGQFMTLAVSIEGKVLKRSYTIASSPTQRYYYELTIKREEKGLVSTYLHDHLKRETFIDVAGPGGVFTFTGTEAKSIVLIGGGVGITPHMSIIRYFADRCWKGKIYLLYACRTPADIIFQNELGELQARNPNLQQYITVTRAEGTTWSGLRGYFSKQSIALCIPDIASTRVHLCGPVAMMDSVKTVLAELGVPKSSIKTENFGPVKRGGAEIVAEKRAPESIVSTSTTVTFKTSGKSAFLPPRLTVLEAAESVGVEIENSCRSGTCGMCKVKLLEGKAL